MKLLRTFALFVTVIIIAAPFSASAATTTPEKPTCLMVSTVLKNGQPIILWASVNATTITDERGMPTTALGYKLVPSLQTSSYTYGFTGPGGTVVCTAIPYTTASVSTPAPVVAPITVTTTTTVTASVPGTQLLSVSMLPLISGGQTTAGASIPVAYIKVSNRGTGTASIKGFTLTDRGNASAENDVIGFSTNDDKGGSRATIGGTEGSKVAVNESAFVPLAADLAPGQIRIFTIKAILSSLYHEAGKSLLFDVTSVDSSASVTGSFPIPGVNWYLTN